MSDRSLPQVAILLPVLRRQAWVDAWRAVALARRVIVTRHELAGLGPRLLADIGVTRAEALTEAARAPWDVEPRRRHPARRPPSGQWNDRVRLVWRRWQSRRRIVDLDARLLKDIGVSYADAELEANKPFWR
jgi:uncharacterized protein YjiS (DUF1127 family)